MKGVNYCGQKKWTNHRNTKEIDGFLVFGIIYRFDLF